MNAVLRSQTDGFGNMLMWFCVISNETREALLEAAGCSDCTVGISYTSLEPRANRICEFHLFQRAIEQKCTIAGDVVAIYPRCEIEELLERQRA